MLRPRIIYFNIIFEYFLINELGLPRKLVDNFSSVSNLSDSCLASSDILSSFSISQICITVLLRKLFFYNRVAKRNIFFKLVIIVIRCVMVLAGIELIFSQ